MENPPLKIRVSNLPPDATQETIRFFFETTRKSGGGNIKDVDFDSKSKTAIITFEDDEAVERVIGRLPLQLNEKNIDVEIYKPNQPLSTKLDEAAGSTDFAIEVRGMKPTTSKDTILLYFECPKGADADVQDIQYIGDEKKYILWFEEKSAIDVVLNQQHKVDGQMLEVKRYIPPPPVPKYDNKVFITNINPATSKDGLDNFLEAKARASTEEIKFGEEEGTALVTFKEPLGKF